MALADFIPDDTNPHLELAPSVETRRIYDRLIYADDTANTVAPVLQYIGFPARVAGSIQTTIFAKPKNGVMVASSDPNAVGAWYIDVIVNTDPDLTPNEIHVTLSHPAWGGSETRIVPYGTTKVCWSDLTLVPA